MRNADVDDVGVAWNALVLGVEFDAILGQEIAELCQCGVVVFGIVHGDVTNLNCSKYVATYVSGIYLVFNASTLDQIGEVPGNPSACIGSSNTVKSDQCRSECQL